MKMPKSNGYGFNIHFVIMLMLFFCFIPVCVCKNYEAAASSYAKAYLGLEVFLAEGEVIQVEYEEVWYFEPYSKQYYIETENWGMYGLEQDAELAEKLALDYLELKDDEHVVYIQTYDYQVCDYVEEFIYTIAEDEYVTAYCILLERNGVYFGGAKCENWNMDIDVLEYEVENVGEGAYIFNPITYMPPYMVHDLNDDGYIDIYNSSETFLWKDGIYKICTNEEREELINSRYQTNNDLKELEKIEEFKNTFSVVENVDNGKITYLQFHDISYAEEINEQIKKIIEERKTEELNIYINEIVYVGEKYLVVFMYTQDPNSNISNEGVMYEDCQYLTFNLSTGRIVTFEEILGEDYAREDIETMVWKTYERSILNVPDQYTIELYEKYCADVYEKYNLALTASEEGKLKNYNPKFEQFLHYYCTDEGIVIVYGHSSKYGWSKLPLQYYLNERLEIIDDKDIETTFCPWEEIALDK